MDRKCHLARAVSNRSDESAPSGLFKCHSTVFVFLTAWGVVKSPHGSVLEPEGPTRAHAKSKIWNGIWLAHYVYLYQYRLPKPLNVSNGPRTAPVRPGRHRGARSVRRESDANRITFIYTISLGAARFTITVYLLLYVRMRGLIVIITLELIQSYTSYYEWDGPPWRPTFNLLNRSRRGRVVSDVAATSVFVSPRTTHIFEVHASQ